MKRIFILICFFCFIFGGMCPSLSGKSGRRAYFGVNFGTFPLVSFFDLYRLGGEVGYQFTERTGIIGEFAYGHTNSSYGPWGNRRLSGKIKYGCIQINVSLIYIVPLRKRLTHYVGLGLGLYSIKIKENWTDFPMIPPYEPSSGTITKKIMGFAPHFNFGIEFAVSNRITVFSEGKLIYALSELKEIPGLSDEGEVHFSRTKVKIGVRLNLQRRKR